MSGVRGNKGFSTKLKNETFLRFADNSRMGVLIIQRGFLKYFNKRFTEIFGYNEEDILNWKKREFYKIVHPDDLPHLVEKFEIGKDKRTIIIRFRGVRKDKSIINIENYNCQIKYNNKFAVLSSYVPLEESFDEFFIPKITKTKEEKLILLNFHPKVVNFLEDNNISYESIKHYSYRQE